MAHVEEGMGKHEAARLFKISPDTLYGWLRSPDLSPRKHGLRRGKIDKTALTAHVEAYPDALLRERADHVDVTEEEDKAFVKLFRVKRSMRPRTKGMG